ncbi:molecular chaperone HtpG [Stappia indica]|uniref:molecular chaperone HtpG n=1 Tax=Stappia indica TaxID=538381 RepID=UPI001CD36FD5|nr:molecular chaperone HtpG [Stappia indica]MCA1298127.1 molecular chaperone HtpG [Stappia indica]
MSSSENTTATTDASAPETHAFQAEVARLLHLMVHSVYSNKDIFLRELVSNAADACERLRHEAVTRPELTRDDPDFAIRLEADKDKRLLIVADNGSGMSREEMVSNLGTIARSGTRAFIDSLGDNKDGSALIGQFGVGFYSAFMVADEVEVISRAAGEDTAWCWRSDGLGAFSIEPVELDAAPARGTRVVLHLKEDAAEYAEPAKIERIVRAYSAHVPVPIVLLAPKEATAGEDNGAAAEGGTEERQLADGTALWTRPKSGISEEEYKEFYGHVSGQFDDPALTLHYRAEGRHEYSVLVFLPSMAPFDLFDPDRKGRVKLYVRRVFIADDIDLLPAWLRFARGVIDSADLPLNLSREMLQTNPVLESIRKGVTNRILSELQKLAKNDVETFNAIWESFGPVLKEGLYEDAERRDKLLELVRFRSSADNGASWRSLADYVGAMKENQTQIFYATGASQEAIASSPHLEGFRARGVEVLYLADPVDAFWIQMVQGFEGKPFQSVTQGAAALDEIPAESTDADKAEADKQGAGATDIGLVTAFLKETLGDKVSDVRASARLSESPVCLVAPEHGPDRQLEKLMARQKGAGAGMFAPVLEFNPKHALVTSLSGRLGAEGSKDDLADMAFLLFDQALILDGEAPSDAAAFARRLASVMQRGLA